MHQPTAAKNLWRKGRRVVDDLVDDPMKPLKHRGGELELVHVERRLSGVFGLQS